MKMKLRDVVLEIPTSDDLVEIKNQVLESQAIIEDDFEKFEVLAEKLVSSTKKLLVKKFNPDIPSLQSELYELISYSASLNQFVVDANSFLTVFDIVNFACKEKNLTEADRKKITDLRNINQINLLNKLKGLESKIDKKINVIQSILKAEIFMYSNTKNLDEE